jgi:hypothetical protein
VLIDAICAITGTTESYSSPIPEPFTYIPETTRSIEVNDGSITSSFLEMFGRPARDTGYEMERNNTVTPAQRLHIFNSSHIQDKIRNGPALKKLATAGKQPEKLLEDLYLTILSRYPTEQEKRTFAQRPASKDRAGDLFQDIVWSLFNTSEFLMKH